MLQLRLTDPLQLLDLATPTAITLEANSRLLEDDPERIGSYSLPFNLPLSPANRAALGFPDAPSVRGARRRVADVELLDEGHVIARGDLLVRETNTAISAAFLFGTGPLRRKLAAARLTELQLGGERVLASTPAASNSEWSAAMAARMQEVSENAEQYPYVFAPVRCCGFLANWYEPTWTTTDTLSSSGPTQHGFVWNAQWSTVDQILPWPGFAGTYRAMPLPRLRYVIEQAFAELGIPLDSDFWDSETSQLVLLPTATLDELRDDDLLLRKVNAWKRSFRIGDVLPDISLLELIEVLEGTFALVLEVDHLGRARLRRTDRIFRTPGAVDLSAYVGAGRVRTFGTEKAFRLLPDVSNEEAADLSDKPLAADAASWYDLGGTVLDENLVRRVVDERRYYQYIRAEDGDNLRFEWQRIGLELPAAEFGTITDEVTVTDVAIKAGQVQDIRMPLTDLIVDVVAFEKLDALEGLLTIDGRLTAAGWWVLVTAQVNTTQNGVWVVAAGAWSRAPEADTWAKLEGLTVRARYGRAASYGLRFTATLPPVGYLNTSAIRFTRDVPPPATRTVMNDLVDYSEGVGYAPALNQRERQKLPRLAFWRGWQPYRLGDGSLSGDVFPCVSTDSTNHYGERLGSYSLRVDGPDGLAEQWWRPLLEARTSGDTDKLPIYVEGARLQWLLGLLNQRIAIEGRHYLIRRLTVPLGSKVAATLEVLPIS